MHDNDQDRDRQPDQQGSDRSDRAAESMPSEEPNAERIRGAGESEEPEDTDEADDDREGAE